MMQRTLATVALSTISLATLIGAKPPATSSFDPEIAYTYASGSYMDLRLANRAGTAAVLVHRAGYGKITSFDVSIEGPNRIVYAEGYNLYVRTWQQNPLVISEPQLIYDGTEDGDVPDFSPAGDKVAFPTQAASGAGIAVYDFTVTDPSQRLSTPLRGWRVFSVRWAPSGDALFFAGYEEGTTPNPIPIWRLSMTDPEAMPTIAVLPGSTAYNLDVSRAPSNPSTDLMAFVPVFPNIEFRRLDGSFVRSEPWGTNPHFNCSNSAIIHRGADRRRSTKITSLAPGGASETWSSDSNVHHTDWIPQVPCI